MLLHTLQTDCLTTQVHDSREAMGAAAAACAARAIRELFKTKEIVNMIFAAAPSQNEMLANLLKEDVDFSRINAFHMDEYTGLPAHAPQSFSNYLTEHIFSKAPFHSVHLIPADQPIDAACALYTQLLQDNPPDIVCMGIGENGHVAFNDPPVADFNDPVLIKAVALDEICRTQQVHDGCFATLSEVPTHALTLTVPALMRARYLVCTVPGATKAAAVKAMIHGPVGTQCPATALRSHAGAVMFLDPESAALLMK